ncbi:Uncharacterised protein [uncultured archaeon]|nr:Uncharacterised protein [uncultured archaeon]
MLRNQLYVHSGFNEAKGARKGVELAVKEAKTVNDFLESLLRGKDLTAAEKDVVEKSVLPFVDREVDKYYLKWMKEPELKKTMLYQTARNAGLQTAHYDPVGSVLTLPGNENALLLAKFFSILETGFLAHGKDLSFKTCATAQDGKQQEILDSFDELIHGLTFSKHALPTVRFERFARTCMRNSRALDELLADSGGEPAVFCHYRNAEYKARAFKLVAEEIAGRPARLPKRMP